MPSRTGKTGHHQDRDLFYCLLPAELPRLPPHWKDTSPAAGQSLGRGGRIPYTYLYCTMCCRLCQSLDEYRVASFPFIRTSITHITYCNELPTYLLHGYLLQVSSSSKIGPGTGSIMYLLTCMYRRLCLVR